MPVQVLMPALSPTMTEGTLAKWLVKEGDEVNSGDVIAEIETDKATMEVEAVDEGIVAKILVSEGTEGVPVNQLIAVLAEEGEDPADAANAAGDSAPAPAASAAPEKTPAAATSVEPAASPAPAAPVAESGERIFASPLARRIAADEDLDLKLVSGSGPRGRIVKADVEAAIAGGTAKAGAAAPAAATAADAPAPMSTENPFEPEFKLQSLNNMRKTIARRLTESKQNVPHFYLSVDIEIDKLLEMRKELNARADGSFKLSVNDIVIKAVGIALRKVPAANASWANEGLKLYKRADVSVAVAIDGGLITPVVRDAGGKGLETISNEMKELAAKARDGKLQPEEFQGGTFSVSNLGMFGIDNFQAVINPPQACILAVGAGKQKAVVKDGALSVATVMTATLSVDHRAVDGAVGAEFLKVFKGLLEEPLSMML
ncbi:pyruvate dehydrogenase complex dihydrolipoamide acetyltransferase [Aestuariispira insulae]|uniref:Acetyltransferase component of pyruvate dehydrogenase complex n=1 Tax=Aestuariispira insulae TaxID=1461337 RepID=A0A3D9HWH0_9PROT|nr:pyruvate dehydrogenase complex dihydrolipoamide acetyltransferase [Aestuariispira insulae]RED53266.1 pyruvate dehydrogenase E2 component (dihydrolipoamide acetyltransferase) [Aestuariispira insulae]